MKPEFKSKEELIQSHPYLKVWIEHPDDSDIRCLNEDHALWAIEKYAEQFRAILNKIIPDDYEVLMKICGKSKTISLLQIDSGIIVEAIQLLKNSTHDEDYDGGDDGESWNGGFADNH